VPVEAFDELRAQAAQQQARERHPHISLLITNAKSGGSAAAATRPSM